jgi:hypothetical protein
MNKLNEGIAKDVTPDKIIMALKKVKARYETARKYAKILSVEEDHIQDMTEEIAECMLAGIDADDISTITLVLKEKAETMSQKKAEALNKKTIRAMKTMGRSGVESQYVLSVVQSAFESGYNADGMVGLENSFKLNARWTDSVSDLAQAYSIAIDNGATFDDVDLYDPWTTSFGSRMPDGFGFGTPGGGGPAGGIPPGRPTGGSPPEAPSGSPPGAPGSAPPGGGGADVPPPGPPPGN